MENLCPPGEQSFYAGKIYIALKLEVPISAGGRGRCLIPDARVNSWWGPINHAFTIVIAQWLRV